MNCYGITNLVSSPHEFWFVALNEVAGAGVAVAFSGLNPEPQIRNLETLDLRPQTPNPILHTPNQPHTPNPKPQTSNLKPQIPNPKPKTLTPLAGSY